MSERELVMKCIPQIAEMALVIADMSPEQYGIFKKEHLEEVRETCPKALGFIKKIYTVIEYTLAVDSGGDTERKEIYV